MEITEFLVAHPYVSFAQTLFMVWMLVDAYRRGAEFFWFWVILFVPVIGAWVYFFAVKIGDFRDLGALFQRREALEALRYRTRQTPTLANNLALAERLIELNDHDEAVTCLESVLKQEPEHLRGLYCMAVCRKAQGTTDQAVKLLETLLARDPRWSNYLAWGLLVECRGLLGDAAGALESCRQLVRMSPCLEHQCLLAKQLIEGGQAAEAGSILSTALQDYAYAPRFVRSRDRRWCREARRLQRQAGG